MKFRARQIPLEGKAAKWERPKRVIGDTACSSMDRYDRAEKKLRVSHRALEGVMETP